MKSLNKNIVRKADAGYRLCRKKYLWAIINTVLPLLPSPLTALLLPNPGNARMLWEASQDLQRYRVSPWLSHPFSVVLQVSLPKMSDFSKSEVKAVEMDSTFPHLRVPDSPSLGSHSQNKLAANKASSVFRVFQSILIWHESLSSWLWEKERLASPFHITGAETKSGGSC